MGYYFVHGLWDGVTALVSLVLVLFSPAFHVHSVHVQTWMYELGYVLGAGLGFAIGLNSLRAMAWTFVIILILKLVVEVVGPVTFGTPHITHI